VLILCTCCDLSQPIYLAARSNAWVCGRSLAGIAGSNPAGGNGSLFLVSVVCFQVEVSPTDRSLVQRSPTDCSASVCNREASIMRKPWPTRSCWSMGEGGYLFSFSVCES